MLTTKNYYSNPNLLKKVRIRTITANQNEEFNKVILNSFTNETQVNAYHNYSEQNNQASAANSSIGW